MAIHQYEHSFQDIIWTRNRYRDRMSHYGKFVPCMLFEIYQDPIILIKLGLRPTYMDLQLPDKSQMFLHLNFFEQNIEHPKGHYM